MPARDLTDPTVLAEEIASGRIWSGPPWAVELAVEAINEGKVPMPANVPDEVRAYITRDEAPALGPVEPMAGGGL